MKYELDKVYHQNFAVKRKIRYVIYSASVYQYMWAKRASRWVTPAGNYIVWNTAFSRTGPCHLTKHPVRMIASTPSSTRQAPARWYHVL